MEQAAVRHPGAQKGLLWVTYLMHLLVLPAVVAAPTNYLEARQMRSIADEGAGGEAERALLLWTHHEWLIRTFCTFVVFAMVAAGTFYYGFGLLVAGGAVAWWFYRIIRGMWTLAESRNLPVSR